MAQSHESGDDGGIGKTQRLATELTRRIADDSETVEFTDPKE